MKNSLMKQTTMNDFEIIKRLGTGSFGSVFKVLRKIDQKIYAIKSVPIDKLNKREQENSVNEVRILASVNHPNIIGYKEAFWDDNNNTLNIVMEYADDGDLQSKIAKIKKEKGHFSENLIWKYTIQMIRGLKVLHEKHIMHRDLKSANIFLAKNAEQCKLGDMNVSKVAKNNILRTQTGTPYYASPEVWKDRPYSYKSDLWSVGCVIYELCTLHPPFRGRDLDELYANVIKGKFDKIDMKLYSEDLWKAIKMLLKVDENERVDCKEFLNSSLVKRKIKELGLGGINGEEGYDNAEMLSTIDFKNVKEIKGKLPRFSNYKQEEEMKNNVDFGYIFEKYAKLSSSNLDNDLATRLNTNICEHELSKKLLNNMCSDLEKNEQKIEENKIKNNNYHYRKCENRSGILTTDYREYRNYNDICDLKTEKSICGNKDYYDERREKEKKILSANKWEESKESRSKVLQMKRDQKKLINNQSINQSVQNCNYLNILEERFKTEINNESKIPDYELYGITKLEDGVIMENDIKKSKNYNKKGNIIIHNNNNNNNYNKRISCSPEIKKESYRAIRIKANNYTSNPSAAISTRIQHVDYVNNGKSRSRTPINGGIMYNFNKITSNNNRRLLRLHTSSINNNNNQGNNPNNSHLIRIQGNNKKSIEFEKPKKLIKMRPREIVYEFESSAIHRNKNDNNNNKIDKLEKNDKIFENVYPIEKRLSDIRSKNKNYYSKIDNKSLKSINTKGIQNPPDFSKKKNYYNIKNPCINNKNQSRPSSAIPSKRDNKKLKNLNSSNIYNQDLSTNDIKKYINQRLITNINQNRSFIHRTNTNDKIKIVKCNSSRPKYLCTQQEDHNKNAKQKKIMNSDLNIDINSYSNVRKIAPKNIVQQKSNNHQKTYIENKRSGNSPISRDLTEPDLMMMINPIKIKEKRTRKNLNISGSNLVSNANTFLQHHVKPTVNITQNNDSNTNRIINNCYLMKNNSKINSNAGNMGGCQGTQVFNNYYSFSGITSKNCPVKVINVFNN